MCERTSFAMMPTVVQQHIAMKMNCFVCDVIIIGKSYKLANCRTQRSKSRVIEKLGELVGKSDRYAVVLQGDDDLICRSCANLMNTIDRLESELKSVRSVILSFLEQKYALDQGSLSSRNLTHPPPLVPIGAKRPNPSPCPIENKKSKSGFDCKKCSYTTSHRAFMIHHIRQHMKKEQESEKGEQGDKNEEGSNIEAKCGTPDMSEKDESTAATPITSTTPITIITAATPATTAHVKKQAKVEHIESDATDPDSSDTLLICEEIPQPTVTIEIGQVKQMVTLSDDGSFEIIPWDPAYNTTPQ